MLHNKFKFKFKRINFYYTNLFLALICFYLKDKCQKIDFLALMDVKMFFTILSHQKIGYRISTKLQSRKIITEIGSRYQISKKDLRSRKGI